MAVARRPSRNVSLSDILSSNITVGGRCDKLAKFLATMNGSAGYEGRGVQREFYDRALDVLDVVFGEAKAAKRAWLHLAKGVNWRQYERCKKAEREQRWNKAQRSQARAAVALVNHLLNPSVDDKGSFMSMTRVAHRFAFPLEYFPFHVRRSVRSGMPFAVPLLRLVRDRNAERGNPMLSIKPMDKHVMLSLFECIIMYLAHYPASAKRRKRSASTPAQRQSQQHRGQFFGIVGRKTRPPLLYTDVQVQKLRSPFLTLVWHYLHHFITSMKPAGGDGFQLTQGRGFNDPTAASTPCLSYEGMLLLLAIRDFWLLQNPPETLLQDQYMSAAELQALRRTRGRLPQATIDYLPPSQELLQAVLFLIAYLQADQDLLDALSIDPFDGNSSAAFRSQAQVKDPLVELHWSLYTFLNVNLVCCPLLDNENLFPDVVDVWLTYLTPWRAAERGAGNKPLDPAVRAKRQGQTRLLKDGVATFRDSMQLVTGIVQSGGMGGGGGSGGSGGGGGRGSDDGLGGRRGGGSSGSGRHGRRQRKIQPRAGDFANKFYKKYNTHWEPYVVHNYAFYVSLLGQFVRKARELDFVSGRKRENLRMLERVLLVFEPCVVETLTRCSKVIERVIGQTNTGSRFHTPARLAGSEWIFNALQQHMRALGDGAFGVMGVPPTLASFREDAEALLYVLSEADMSQDLEKRRMQAEWANEPLFDRWLAWVGSLVPGMSTTHPRGLVQNDREVAKFRTRLQQCTQSIRKLFGVTKTVRARTASDLMSSTSSLPRALAPDTLRSPRVHGFLSPEGRWQLQHGLRKTRALDVAHIGAEAHMRPAGTYESATLLRLLLRLSRRIDTWRKLDTHTQRWGSAMSAGGADRDGGGTTGGGGGGDGAAHAAAQGPLQARVLSVRPSATFAVIRPLADVRILLLLPAALWIGFHLLRVGLLVTFYVLRALFEGNNGGVQRSHTSGRHRY